MVLISRVISKHKYRRTARAKKAWLDAKAKWRPRGGVPLYNVTEAKRGPARWWVVKL